MRDSKKVKTKKAGEVENERLGLEGGTKVTQRLHDFDEPGLLSRDQGR